MKEQNKGDCVTDQTKTSVTRLGAASVVIVRGVDVLVVASSHNPKGRKFQLVGGKAKKDETPTNTTIREVLEESNLVLDPKKLEPLCQVTFEKKDGRSLAHHFFLYRISGEEYGEPNGRKPLKWIPIGNLRNGRLFEWWGYKIPIRVAEKLLGTQRASFPA